MNLMKRFVSLLTLVMLMTQLHVMAQSFTASKDGYSYNSATEMLALNIAEDCSQIDAGNRPEILTSAATNKMQVIVGDEIFMATLADNPTGEAFRTMLPLTLNMSELNGNEKYYYLSNNLPNSPENPGTIHAGDIMLYGSSCVVLFYKTFNTSYSYTRIGSVDNPAGLAEALGTGRVTVTFGLSVTGDVNGDGRLSINDVTDLINLLLTGNAAGNSVADVNGDGQTNISDVTDLINLLLTE